MRGKGSWQLRLLTACLRHVMKPRLLRTKTPQQARREFERAARLFRRSRFVLHLPDPTAPFHHWISVGIPDPDWAMLYFHGGAYFAGSPLTHLGLVARLSKLTGLRALAPRYRLAPEHPASAAFEDARTAHAALLSKGYAPHRIVLGGDSAGAELALAATHLRALGGLVEVTEWPGAPHVWQIFDGYIPEARAALIEVARFVRSLIPLPPPQSGS